MLSRAEEQGDTPDTCESNDGIDYTADERILTAADPRYDIKAEKSDASPVQRADYRKHECDSV